MVHQLHTTINAHKTNDTSLDTSANTTVAVHVTWPHPRDLTPSTWPDPIHVTWPYPRDLTLFFSCSDCSEVLYQSGWSVSLTSSVWIINASDITWWSMYQFHMAHRLPSFHLLPTASLNQHHAITALQGKEFTLPPIYMQIQYNRCVNTAHNPGS